MLENSQQEIANAPLNPFGSALHEDQSGFDALVASQAPGQLNMASSVSSMNPDGKDPLANLRKGMLMASVGVQPNLSKRTTVDPLVTKLAPIRNASETGGKGPRNRINGPMSSV